MTDIKTLYIVSKNEKLSNILFSMITQYDEKAPGSPNFIGKGVGADQIRPMVIGAGIWQKGMLHDTEKAIIIGNIDSEYKYKDEMYFVEDKYGVRYAVKGNLAVILVPNDTLRRVCNNQNTYKRLHEELSKEANELVNDRYKLCNPGVVVATNILFPGIATIISIICGISDNSLVEEQLYTWGIMYFFWYKLYKFINADDRCCNVNCIAENNRLAAMKAEKGKKKIDSYLDAAINKYNLKYSELNSAGVMLMYERQACGELLIPRVTELINTLSRTPKDFSVSFEFIHANKDKFSDRCYYASKELEAAKASAFTSGGGAIAGAAIANVAPNVIMWVSSTFGQASASAAISSFSGAATGTAAMAWTAGGTGAAAVGGTAAGSSICAVAGPIGWAVCGVCVLGSIIIFKSKLVKLEREKKEEIAYLENNTSLIALQTEKINKLLNETKSVRSKLESKLTEANKLAGADYESLTYEDKMLLGTVLNLTMSLSELMGRTV